MAEYFDILDDNGNLTGKTKLRSEVHRDGDWHKAVHIWIVNDKNEILLQKRSPNKDSNPNMWDISSAGHLSAGDNSLEGAVREIQEELGINVTKDQLQFLSTLKRASRYTTTFINNEFDDVYLLHLSLDVHKTQLQAEEVSEIKYVSIQEMKDMIAKKDPTLLMHLDEFKILFDILDK